jgi:hypothetical protein
MKPRLLSINYLLCEQDCKLISIISVKEKRKGRLGRGVLFQSCYILVATVHSAGFKIKQILF